MKIIFEFDSTVDPTDASGVTEVSAYGGGLSGTTFTPTGAYTLIAAEGGAVIPDNAYRTYYIDFPVVSAGSYLNGVFSLVAESVGASAVHTFTTDDAIRNFQLITDLQVLKVLISGSSVVNTTLNELVQYADTINADGSVTGTGAKSTLLLRQKLYDSQGDATSINPVEKRTFNSALQTYIDGWVSGAGSDFQ